MPAPESDVDEFGALQRLRATRNLERVARRCGREIGTNAETFGRQHINRRSSSAIAMSEKFGTHPVEHESEIFEQPDESSHGSSDAGIHDHVEIGADTRPLDVVFECVEQNHLAADENPACRCRFPSSAPSR